MSVEIPPTVRNVSRQGAMRLISGLLLIIAILAAVLWLTASMAAEFARIIVALFLVLFILSLFLKKGRAGKL